MRKAAQDGLRPGASQGFGPVQYRESVVLAVNMLTEPSDWFYHCQHAVASTILPIIYGKALAGSKGEANVAEFHGFIHGLTRAAMPGANLVELFTWMRHTPSRWVYSCVLRRAGRVPTIDTWSQVRAVEAPSEQVLRPAFGHVRGSARGHSHSRGMSSSPFFLTVVAVEANICYQKQGDKSPSLVRSLIEDGHRYGVSNTESCWLASAAL